jgi:hypothetical protein
VQHVFQLLGREALDYNIFLFFPKLVLLLEHLELSLMGSSIGAEASLRILEALELLLVKAMQKTHPSLFHLDQPTLEPLPQFVVLGPPHIGAMPDGVLDELLQLEDPLGLQHVLLDGLDRNHEPRHVLDQDVVACDEQLLFLDGALERGEQLLLPVLLMGGEARPLPKVVGLILLDNLGDHLRLSICLALYRALRAVGAWDVLVTTHRQVEVFHQRLILIRDDVVRKKQVVKKLIAYFSLAVTGKVLVINI